MRVRSFRNTVLFFFYFAAAKILQSRGKAKGGSFLGGGGLGGREDWSESLFIFAFIEFRASCIMLTGIFTT